MARTNNRPTCADTPFRLARRNHYEGLLAAGFTLIRLYKIKPEGDCACSPTSSTRLDTNAKWMDYRRLKTLLPCKNPGKHPVGSAKKAVIKSTKKIEEHLDNGGSIGICLRIDGLPAAPIRLVILDRDRHGSSEWLRCRGISSPLEVIGKRGGHDYFRLPDGVPDLNSDTSRLNPGKDNPTTEGKPGIDIKTSGLVVAAYSVNKTLYWDGRDISCEPETVARIFGSLESLRASLPEFDPRTISPGMTVHVPTATQEDGALRLDEENGDGQLQPKDSLDQYRPPADGIRGPLQGVRYSARMDLARNFARTTKAGITGQRASGNHLRVVAALMRRYWLSEADAFTYMRQYYAPRCQDEDGNTNRPSDHALATLLLDVRREELVDPIGRWNKEEFQGKTAAEINRNLVARDTRKRDKRRLKDYQEKVYLESNIEAFLCSSQCPLKEGSRVPHPELLARCNAWIKQHFRGAAVTGKRLSMVLDRLHFQRFTDTVNGKRVVMVAPASQAA